MERVPLRGHLLEDRCRECRCVGQEGVWLLWCRMGGEKGGMDGKGRKDVGDDTGSKCVTE